MTTVIVARTRTPARRARRRSRRPSFSIRSLSVRVRPATASSSYRSSANFRLSKSIVRDLLIFRRPLARASHGSSRQRILMRARFVSRWIVRHFQPTRGRFVSTLKAWKIGVGSVFPAASTANAAKTCRPSGSFGAVSRPFPQGSARKPTAQR